MWERDAYPLFSSQDLWKQIRNQIIHGSVRLKPMRNPTWPSSLGIYRKLSFASMLTIIVGCDVQHSVALRIVNAARGTPLADVNVEKKFNASSSTPNATKPIGATNAEGLITATLAEKEWLILRKPGFVETTIGVYAGYLSVTESRPDLMRPTTRRYTDELQIIPNRYRVEIPLTSQEITVGLEPVKSKKQ